MQTTPMFPPPSLKFRTLGFPQYGFKRVFRPDLRPLLRTYTRLKLMSQASIAQRGIFLRHPLTQQSRPEALRYSAGYVVPQNPTLLWPHPKLSTPPTGLFSSSKWVFALRYSLGWSREAPHFTLRICAYVPPSIPRQIERLFTAIASPFTLAFIVFAAIRHLYCHANRFMRGGVTRLQSSLYAAARRLACPSPTRTFTVELSLCRVTSI